MQCVDLGGFEACDRDIEIILDQEVGEGGELNRQQLSVPAGALGNPVVGQEQRPLLGVTKPGDDDRRNGRHPE